MILEGVYLDGQSSKQVDARLESIADIGGVLRLTLFGESYDIVEQLEFSYGDIKIESPVGDTPREINLGQGRLFVTRNSVGVDNIAKMLRVGKPSSFIHKLENNILFIAFSIIATIIFSWGVVEYGIPKSASIIAHQLPDFTTKKFGDSLSILDETIFDPSALDESRQQEVRTLVAPYFAAQPTLNATLEFRSGMQANAFALPDGVIVLTDGFVDLVENDNELLAVLFHEMGHLKHKHIVRRVLQDSMVTILIVYILGDIDTMDLLVGLPTVFLDLAYSRQFEAEADIYALNQLHEQNISVDHFSTIMKRLQDVNIKSNAESSVGIEDKSQLSDFLTTHPSTQDRVNLVAEFKKQRLSVAN